MTGVPIKRGHLDAEWHTGRTQTPCEGGGRDRLKHRRLSANLPKPGAGRARTVSLPAVEGTAPANLGLGLPVSRTGRKNFCYISYPLGGTLLRQPERTNKHREVGNSVLPKGERLSSIFGCVLGPRPPGHQHSLVMNTHIHVEFRKQLSGNSRVSQPHPWLRSHSGDGYRLKEAERE